MRNRKFIPGVETMGLRLAPSAAVPAADGSNWGDESPLPIIYPGDCDSPPFDIPTIYVLAEQPTDGITLPTATVNP